MYSDPLDYYKISKALVEASKKLQAMGNKSEKGIEALKEAEMNLQNALINMAKLYNE